MRANKSSYCIAIRNLIEFARFLPKKRIGEQHLIFCLIKSSTVVSEIIRGIRLLKP